jgi:AcrR family transcriptional regulator
MISERLEGDAAMAPQDTAPQDTAPQDMAPRKAAPRTARERARVELTREIKEEARRQLAATGADGMSLRAVARELGMVSSALYRYYPSRDDLLTALIIDAYNAIGEAAEQAIASAVPGSGAGAARARWIAASHAIRDWARSHPHEYALIYGSPVPGYRAPEATIGPAARVPLAFAGVLAEANAGGELARGQEWQPVAGALADQAAALAAALSQAPLSQAPLSQAPLSQAPLSQAPLSPATGGAGARFTVLPGPEVPPDSLVRTAIAWTQLFGMISFELFGQFVGSFEPADELFAYAVVEAAAFVGLR